jgi:hypothetical protein
MSSQLGRPRAGRTQPGQVASEEGRPTEIRPVNAAEFVDARNKGRPARIRRYLDKDIKRGGYEFARGVRRRGARCKSGLSDRQAMQASAHASRAKQPHKTRESRSGRLHKVRALAQVKGVEHQSRTG